MSTVPESYFCKLNPNEQELANAAEAAGMETVKMLKSYFNADGKEPEELEGDYKPVFVGSLYVGNNQFIGRVTIEKCKHKTSEQIDFEKSDMARSGAEPEPYKSKGMLHLKQYEFLSKYHPHEMTGDDDAIARWRQPLIETINRERALYEGYISRLHGERTQAAKSPEERYAETLGKTLGPILGEIAELKRSQSRLP